MINCRRPSNRSSRLALPLGPSNSYGFSTASHGIRRRSAASASRARVSSFSFTSSFFRAASHSFGDTTFGFFMSDLTACVLIFFAFRSLGVQRTSTPILDACFACQAGGARLPIYMTSFFEELQRRKVYRVAAAYIVAAGFLIQMASAAFPAWEVPNLSFRLVIVVLLIGFPIALLLAWTYDLTTHGIQATPQTPGAHRRRNVILLTAAGVIVSVGGGFFLLPRITAHKLDKSIAVLPFQNLSSDPDNA